MKLSTVVYSLAAVASVDAAQSICDKYTTALLKQNTAANQQTLLTLLVNTVVIGNYTKPNTGVYVPGILKAGEFNGQQVNLLPYFDGALASSNRGGSCGVSVNFLDGGGAKPLMHNKPANNPNSNQYDLLTHLYEFFAALLGCSQYGNTVSKYAGFNGMYEVHKFMALSAAEVGYFIQNVGLAAESFGVSDADVDAVAKALASTFGMRCSAPVSVPSFETAELQAICTECDCPKATNPDCKAYGAIIEPEPSASATPTNCGSGHKCNNYNNNGWNWGDQSWPWGQGW